MASKVGTQLRDSVTIVGGGIAGMTAALKLLKAGVNVELYESRDTLGGKFASVYAQGSYHEHAYHFLADWCQNFWAICEEIGVSQDAFEQRPAYVFLRRGEFPNTTAISNLSSPERIWTNLYSGVLPWYEMLLYVYSMLDLLLDNLNYDDTRRRFLNRISINGYIASRPYATDAAALMHQNVMLRAFASPSYRTSARSYRNFLKYAFGSPNPNFFALASDTETGFFKPFVQTLEDLGRTGGPSFKLHAGKSLTRLGLDTEAGQPRISHIEVCDTGSTSGECVPVQSLIVAIPPDNLFDVIRSDQALYQVAPALFDVQKLNSLPMASLDLFLHRKLPDMPAEHVTLIDTVDEMLKPEFRSRYSLSLLDNSQLWRSTDAGHRNTFLNIVAADYSNLAHLGDDVAQRILIEEVMKYLPIQSGDIDWDKTHFTSNVDAPLFLNEVGTWEWRPEATTTIQNLFIAGDYCKTEADIVSLESAVESAIVAAQAACASLPGAQKFQTIEAPRELKTPDFDQLLGLRRILAPWIPSAQRASQMQLKRP
ncbi:MAG: FAD-dependent oxidoreductase [Gammaproteobacteria bacterium]|nr:FAD-dependent oxidoreductase [Gammaproteobacteria bacterium]